jgi:acyl carrier protein
MARSYEEIFKEVSALVAEQLHKKQEEIKPDSTLESLGADSLDRVELIMKMEEHFHIEINDEEAEKLHTVDDAVKYIQSLIK